MFPRPSAEADGLGLVRSLGTPTDVLVHAIEGWAPDVRRFAVEFDDGVQLDLVGDAGGTPPGLAAGIDCHRRQGRSPGSAVDTAGDRPTVGRRGSRMGDARRWAVSDAVKYVHRRAWHEAIERIGEARSAALKLFAAAGSVPYPSFGLTSLLDHEPFELPAESRRHLRHSGRPAHGGGALRAVCTCLPTPGRRLGPPSAPSSTRRWPSVRPPVCVLTASV